MLNHKIDILKTSDTTQTEWSKKVIPVLILQFYGAHYDWLKTSKT